MTQDASPSPIDRAARIREILAKCREALIAGKPLDDARLLSEFPDLLPELQIEIKKLRMVEAARIQAAEPAEESQAPPDSADTPTTSLYGSDDAESQAAPFPVAHATGEPPRIRYFGDYELLSEIARGGMGVVYKARQVSLNRVVAVKMILAGGLASEQDVRRFHAEAEAAANLEHPHIVPIYEVGEHAGMHYFSMGFVQGRSLASIIRENPLPARKAAEYMRKVADAIAYAHSKGVLHRDIKPHNILIDEHDQPRVTDFGLAKRTDAASELTHSGQILGTPSYMPPEQALSDRAAVGPTSDVYSLGSTLYALLTGRPPFQGESPTETLLQVLTREPVSPRLLNPKVERDLETITLKAIEKTPARRYASALALRDDVNRFLTGHTILARPVSRFERSVRWCRRNPSVAVLSAVLLLSLVAGTIISSLFAIQAERKAVAETQARKQSDESAEKAKEAEKKAEIQADLAKQASLDAQQEAANARSAERATKEESRKAYRSYYLAQIGLAVRDWENASISPLKDKLARTLPDHTGGVDLRGFEWYYLQNLCERGHRTLPATVAVSRTGDLAISPDGTQVVAPSPDRTIKLWDLATGTELLTFRGHSDFIECLAFSPDGNQVISGDRGGTTIIWDKITGNVSVTLEKFKRLLCISPDRTCMALGRSIYSTTTGKELTTFEGDLRDALAFALSHDGKRLAIGLRNGAVKIRNVGPGTELISLGMHNGSVVCVAFSPDGKQIVSGSADKTLKIWDSLTGAEKFTLRGHSERVDCVAFRPDGKQIASGGEDRTIRVWDATTGSELLTLRGHTNSLLIYCVTSISYSPDGKQIISAGTDRAIKVWDAVRGQEPLTLRGHAGFRGFVTAVAFSPDGKRVVSSSGDKTLKIWDTVSGNELMTIQAAVPNVCGGVAYSADGKWVAAGTQDKMLKIWSADTGKEHMAFLGHTGPVGGVAFNTNASQIASGSSDSTVKIWDTVTGQELRTLRGHMGTINAVAYSSDDKWIVSGSRDKTLKIWNAATGDMARTLSGHESEVFCVAISANGERVLSGSRDRKVKTWDFASGREMLTLEGHASDVAGVSFSPDSKRIASGSWDNTVKLWDAETGYQLLTLHGHRGTIASNVSCVAFSPDGKRIVSGSWDKTLKIWDTEIRTGSDQARPNEEPAIPKAATPQPEPPAIPATPMATLNDSASQQCAKDVETVAKKLQELNPEFDGKVTPKIENGVVTELQFLTDNVPDISPVRTLTGLKVLRCQGESGQKGKLADVSPLKGMSLTSLVCNSTKVSDLSPLQGMPLTSLYCGLTSVSDLSPLKGMPLTQLNCGSTQVSDLSPLKDCKNLKTLNVKATKVTPEGVVALQRALPNCTIEWDDPAKSTKP